MTKLAEIVAEAIADARGPWRATSRHVNGRLSEGPVDAVRDEISDDDLSSSILSALDRAGYAVVPSVETVEMLQRALAASQEASADAEKPKESLP